MKKIVTVGIVTSGMLMAGGYKIPEQSLNSMALGGAYVAHTTGADTGYYNPANMSFLGEKSYLEGAVTLAHLPAIEFTSMPPYSGESKTEDIPIPHFHYVSKPIGDFRWGASITAPAGLSKRWDTPFQKLSAEEFTLKVAEFNPSVSYKVADSFSIGGGVRVVYSEGVVKSDGKEFSEVVSDSAYNIKRDMEGDTVEFGYNLAMSYRPTSDITLAVTYRSKIDLEEEGTAKLYNQGVLFYDGGASVTIPLPAALNIAVSKTWEERFTLEFNYERTYWSAYKTLDFNYDSPQPVFDDALPKNWKDTDTFRIGATINMDKITMMMGVAIDETPVPLSTLGFELPDSDAKIFSMGFRYQQNEQLSWGAALLYDSKESRTVMQGTSGNYINGSFHEGGALLTTIGVSYEY